MYLRRPVGSVDAKEEIDPMKYLKKMRHFASISSYSPRHEFYLQDRYVWLGVRRSVFVLLGSSVSARVEIASISQQ